MARQTSECNSSIAPNISAFVAFHRAFPRIWRYHAFCTTPHNPSREKFHAGGFGGRTKSPAALSSGRAVVGLVAFPQAIHGGRTMVESIFRNLSMMSRWLRSVFVRAVRGRWGGGMGTHMECDMTGETRTPKPGGTAERTPDVEFPKISIKFDKFPKLFVGQTNIKSDYDIVGCQDILK